MLVYNVYISMNTDRNKENMLDRRGKRLTKTQERSRDLVLQVPQIPSEVHHDAPERMTHSVIGIRCVPCASQVKHYGLGHGSWCSGGLKEQDAQVAADAHFDEDVSNTRVLKK